MLALGSYNPAVITVLIDRYKFCLHHIVHDDGSWRSKLKKFLSSEGDGRDKVLLFDSVDSLKNAQSLDGDDAVKAIVFDTPTKLQSLPSVRVLDVEHKEGRIYQQRTVSVSELNSAVASTEGNFITDIQEITYDTSVEDESPTPDVIDNPPDGAPHYELKPDALSGLLTDTLATMDSDDVRSYFRNRALQYVTGQVTSRSLGGAKRKARGVGSPKADLDKLTDYMNGSDGVAIANAFRAVCSGADASSACEKAGVPINEMNYILAYIDPSQSTNSE